jgi:hypothetical protein
MAVIPFQVVPTPHDGSGTKVVRWVGLTGGDSGQPFVCAAWQDKSVQFIDMDSNGVTIQGSLVPDVATSEWETLNDPQGNALSAITTDRLENILEHVYLIRPLAGATLTGGTIQLLLGSSR